MNPNTVPFSCKEVGKRLDEMGLANDTHLRHPDFAVRFMLKNEVLMVIDLPSGKKQVGFLPVAAANQPVRPS